MASTISSSTTSAGSTSTPSPGETGLAVLTQTTAGAVTQRRTDNLTPASAAVTTSAVDPDDRFVDSGDPDWFSPQETTAPPAGLTYSVPEKVADGLLTLHNNSAVDVAVSATPGTDGPPLTVVRAGTTYTVPDTGKLTTMWVQAPRSNGQAQLIALAFASAQFVAVGPLGDSTTFIPRDEAATADFTGSDPGDRFLDPSESASSFADITYANPETAGVRYSVRPDGSIVVSNSGSTDISVTQSTAGNQPVAFTIVSPGKSTALAALGGGSVVVVQAPRDTAGKVVVLGALQQLRDNTVVAGPNAGGYPAIPVADVPVPQNHAPTGELVEQTRSSSDRTITYRSTVRDIDGDTITYRVVTAPARGAVTAGSTPGTFVYTVTNPADLHQGTVSDSFALEADDGRGGTLTLPVDLVASFAPVNQAPTVLVQRGGTASSGAIFFDIRAKDPDGDRLFLDARTPIGQAEAYGESIGSDGAYVVYYPDLAQAHALRGYTTSIDIIVSDEVGGSVVTTVPIEVPAFNQNPTLTLTPVSEAAVRGDPAADPRAVTSDPVFVYRVDVSDEDGDAVTVFDVRTLSGGSARYDNGYVYYTPKASVGHLYDRPGSMPGKDAFYLDSVSVTVVDGYGGHADAVTNLLIADTSLLPWVEPGTGVVLIMQADRDLMELTYRALYDSPYAKTAWQEFATVFGGLELGDKVAQYPAMYDRYINPPPVTNPPVTTPPTTNPGSSNPGSSNPGSQPTRPSPVANHSSTVSIISSLNAVFQGQNFSDLVSAATNLANVIGLPVVSKVLMAVSAFITGYQGNPVGAVAQAIQGVGSAISSISVRGSEAISIRAGLSTFTKSVLTRAGAAGFLAGAAITTWGYVLEQASKVDPNSFDTTTNYAINNPGVVVEELGKATVKVFTDLGSAFIGSFGGIRKLW